MGSFYSRPASNDQRPQQTLNPEEEEEDEDEERAHQTALAELISHFSRFPQEIASAVIFLPQEELGSPYSRYIVAEALRNVIPLCKENKQMLHTICTTGLPEVLLDIVALDPFIYAWHDKSSRDYHPKLEAYVRDIFFCLYSIYSYISQSRELINTCYKELATQAPRVTQKLWNLVWSNRCLLLPEYELVPPIPQMDPLCGGYRAVVVLFMFTAHLCHKRVASKDSFAWSPSAAQILLYSWPYIDDLLLRQAVCELFILIFPTVQDEFTRSIIPKAVPDLQTGIRLTKQLCSDIENLGRSEGEMKLYSLFLRALLEHGPIIITSIIAGEINIFLTIASAFDRQPCHAGRSSVRLDTYQHFIKALIFYIQGLLPCPGYERIAYTSDLYSFNILTCIASRVLAPAIKQGNEAYANDILLFFRLFPLLAAKSGINPLQRKERYSLKFRALLLQNWLQTIHEIEELHLERGHFGREILRGWKDLRPQLKIRRIKQSSDPDHSVPWGVSCHWRGCLCTKWSHTAFRVCKGCWGPFYCNATCQKLDWREGGHREVCIGHRYCHD